MKNIDLLIGNFFESNTKKLPVGISFAGNYYQIKVRSILNIDHSISLIYGLNNKTYDSETDITYIVLNQKKHFSNTLLIIKHISKLARKDKKNKNVLFYNLNIYNLFYFIYYKFIKKARIVVLLADAGFLVEKKISSQILSKALLYSYGLLTLREIPELRKSQSRIEVMPGIVSKNISTTKKNKTPNTVLLSGSLGITNGLLLALDYFHNQTKFKLFITGVPYLMSSSEFESILEKYKSDNISYLGVLDYKKYIDVLTSSEFSLSLRNPKDIEHQYNFPSKIVEYMSYGNIVISTLNYPELIDEIYLKTEFTLKGLNECFTNILNISLKEREFIAKNAQDFVISHFSEDVLKTKIDNLFKM
ncbi:MAG: hypothetical protein HXX14_13165 [Bacteroidetes bacterium]|nr:hypothetical protein [Bacteroidota bacterium]